MPKNKLSTPDWIKEGYDSKQEYEKTRQKAEPLATSSTRSQSKGIDTKKKTDRTFKIRECPKCKSDNVRVVLTGGLESEIPSDSSGSQAKKRKGIGEWECKKCGWIGMNINEKELTESEFMKYLDDKGEEIP